VRFSNSWRYLVSLVSRALRLALWNTYHAVKKQTWAAATTMRSAPEANRAPTAARIPQSMRATKAVRSGGADFMRHSQL